MQKSYKSFVLCGYIVICLSALASPFSALGQETSRPRSAFAPFSALVVKSTPAQGGEVGIVVGEIVDVVETKDPGQSSVIDETGNRRWIRSDTLLSLDTAEQDVLGRLKEAPDSKELLYSLAVLLHNQSRDKEAIKYADRLLKKHPDFVDGYLNRSQILSSLNRYQEAIDDCNHCLTLAPNASVALVNRGYAHSELGDLDKALSDYDRAVKIDGNVLAMNNRAAIYMKREQYDNAIVEFTNALTQRKIDRLYRGRAKALAAVGKETEARADFASAIELNPANEVNYLSRARYLLDEGDEAALADFKKAVELAPLNPRALSDYGAALCMANDFKPAGNYLEKSLAILPEDALANANYAFVLLKAGKLDESVSYAERAIELNPDLEIAHGNRATALVQLGRHREAVESFNAVLKLSPDNLSTRNDRGLSYLNLGEFNLAKQDIQTCLNARPDHGLYWTNMSRIHERTKRLDKALEALGKSIEVDPKYDIAFYRRGLLLLDEKNDAAGAVADLENATKLDPKWSNAWYHLGRAKTAANDLRGAKDAYTSAIDVMPDMSVGYINRANLHLRTGDYVDAKSDALKAVALAPLDNNATYNLASAHYFLDESASAVQQFSVLLGAGLKQVDVFNRRGDSFQELGRYREAITDYSSSISLNPKIAVSYHARGYCFAKVGEPQKALQDYDICLKLDPTRTSTRLLRGHVYRGNKQYARAASDYERVYTDDPMLNLAIINLAAVLAAATDESVRDGERAVQLATEAWNKSEQKSVLALAVLSLAYAESGDFESAIERGQEAQRLSQGNRESTPPWLSSAIEGYRQDEAWRFPE